MKENLFFLVHFDKVRKVYYYMWYKFQTDDGRYSHEEFKDYKCIT